MLLAALGDFASALVLIVALLVQPERAECPFGYVAGIGQGGAGGRARGVFVCKRLGSDPYPCRGAKRCTPTPAPPGALAGRIYCGAATPVITTYNAVACRKAR